MTIRPQTNRTASLVGVLALSVIAACGGNAKKGAFGSARFSVLASALDQSSIASVKITVNPGPVAPINLVNTDEGWTGVSGLIPIGSQTFTADAYDISGTNVIYHGVSAATPITEGGVAVVDIALQETAPNVTSPFSDTAPVITLVTATSNAVGYNDTVVLNVVSTDADAVDVDTVAWTATCGTFTVGQTQSYSDATGTPETTTTTWQAPASTGSCILTVTVTDTAGALTGANLTVGVDPNNATGAANFALTFNTWPTVSSVTATPDLIAAGGTTSLVVGASDPDAGQSLNYAWSDGGCGGTFLPGANVQNPTYTAAAAGPASCTLTVTVTDEVIATSMLAGGTNTGSLTIQIGTAVAGEFAPTITSSFQTQGTVTGGEVVHFTVGATDPQASLLTFVWASTASMADGASFSNQTDTGATSDVDFTTGCVDASYTVTVTVTNALGLSTQYSFDITNTLMNC